MSCRTSRGESEECGLASFPAGACKRDLQRMKRRPGLVSRQRSDEWYHRGRCYQIVMVSRPYFIPLGWASLRFSRQDITDCRRPTEVDLDVRLSPDMFSDHALAMGCFS